MDLGASACGWTRVGRPWTLLTVRVLITLWAIAIMIYSMILRNQDATGSGITDNPWWTWGINFSSWAFLALIVYFAVASYWSITEIRGGSIARPTSKLERYLWINYEIAYASAWAATFIFWFVINRECTFNSNCGNTLNAANIHLHGVNIIWLLFEMLFNFIPMKPLHVIFVLIFVIVWIIFAQLWHLSGQWIYPMLDTAYTDNSQVAAIYGILLGTAFVCLFCGWGCTYLLEYVYKRKRRSDESDFMDGSPKLSDACC